jgi:hypothetical protein
MNKEKARVEVSFVDNCVFDVIRTKQYQTTRRFMMKKAALFVMAVMAVSVMSSNVPVYAAQKDECLLVSKNCKDEVDTIQQKIKKLNTEIKKGTKVYTPDELKILHNKLKEVNAQMDELMKPGK